MLFSISLVQVIASTNTRALKEKIAFWMTYCGLVASLLVHHLPNLDIFFDCFTLDMMRATSLWKVGPRENYTNYSWAISGNA
jgi:hypothetical protein